MGDHIVRRGAAGSGARRSEPRPTAELGKRELQSLIRDQASAAAPPDLEAELEIGGDVPAQMPTSSSPRLLAHTLRREPTPDGMPAAVRPAGESSPSSFDRDVSTIAMPRLERPDAMDAVPSELASESAHTRQLRQGRGACTDFDDDPVPPPADDFDHGHPVTDLAVARAKRLSAAAVASFSPSSLPLPAPSSAAPPIARPKRTSIPALLPASIPASTPASIPATPRIDRELATPPSLARRTPPPPRPRAPAGRLLRVLPITLAVLVAVSAAYLLLHSGL